MSDPRLLQARSRIKAILDEFDIAGHVCLHNAPNRIEVLTKLNPSYSKIIGLPPLVHIRSKLDEYGGDKDAQRRDLEATANMVQGMAEALALNAMQLLELSKVIDAATGAEHTPLRRDD